MFLENEIEMTYIYKYKTDELSKTIDISGSGRGKLCHFWYVLLTIRYSVFGIRYQKWQNFTESKHGKIYHFRRVCSKLHSWI